VAAARGQQNGPKGSGWKNQLPKIATKQKVLPLPLNTGVRRATGTAGWRRRNQKRIEGRRNQAEKWVEELGALKNGVKNHGRNIEEMVSRRGFGNLMAIASEAQEKRRHPKGRRKIKLCAIRAIRAGLRLEVWEEGGEGNSKRKINRNLGGGVP